MSIYQIFNGNTPTTAKFVKVDSGTTLLTLLQIASSTTIGFKVKEWGFNCDAPSAASLMEVELFSCTGAATVTAHVTAGINRVDARAIEGGDPVTNLLRVSTTLTGFTASGEGTVAAPQMYDQVMDTVPTTNGYSFKKQYPLGEEPYVGNSRFLRIRVTTSVAMDMLCYSTVEI